MDSNPANTNFNLGSAGVRRLGLLLAAIGAVAVYQYRREVGQWIIEVEHWIASLGFWGPLVFVALFIVMTLAFFPDSVLSAIAGVLFGPLLGTAVVVVAAVTTQCLAFAISRRFFQQWARTIVEGRPKLAAIERAVDRGSLRVQLLLRLAPVNPVIISHVMGTTRTRFRDFLIGCLAIIPGLVVQVYIGYAASHMIKVAGEVSQYSKLHSTLVAIGVVIGLSATLAITRLAQKAIAEAER